MLDQIIIAGLSFAYGYYKGRQSVKDPGKRKRFWII